MQQSHTAQASRQSRGITPHTRRTGVFMGDKRFFAFKENNIWYAPPIGCPAPKYFVGVDYSVFAKLPARTDEHGEKHEAEHVVLLRMKREIIRSGGRIKGHKFHTVLKGAF